MLTSNSYFKISLTGNQVDNDPAHRNMFKYNESGNLPFTVQGNNRTVSSSMYKSANALQTSVELSYYFDNHTYLKPSLDTVELERTVFTLTPGMDVDITLNPTLVCPEKHEVQHSITSMRLDGTTPLPAGLVMDAQGHITGTLTEEAKNDPITVVVYFEGSLYNTTNAVLNFYVNDKLDEIKKSIDPNAMKNLDHVHTFGDWATDNLSVHSHICSGCGAEEFAPHNWSDDVTIIEKATPEKDGAMLLTCSDCYAQKIVSYAYEDEGDSADVSGKLGDADNDDVVSILDVTAIQRYLAHYDVDPFIPTQANVDLDDAVTILDATGIQRYLANLSHPIGIGNYG